MNVSNEAYADQLDLSSFVRILWNSRYLIASVAAVFSIAAIIYSLLASPIYRAEVAVTRVEEDGFGGALSQIGQLGGLAGLVGANVFGAGADRKADAVLRSRRLVEEFIKRHVPMAELFEGKAEPSLWKAVERFQGDVVEIRDDKLSGVTEVAIYWKDPDVAAEWANAFVALANELLRTRALEESSRNIKYLQEQIAKTDVVELRRVLYNLVESETKTHMLANARPEYAFTVVDPAVAPELRWFPRRTIIVLLGGLAGLAMGVLLAFARNAWARGVAK